MEIEGRESRAEVFIAKGWRNTGGGKWLATQTQKFLLIQNLELVSHLINLLISHMSPKTIHPLSN